MEDIKQIKLLDAHEISPLVRYTPATVTRMYQACPDRLPPAVQRPAPPGGCRRPAPIWFESTVLEWLKSLEVDEKAHKPEVQTQAPLVRSASVRGRGRPPRMATGQGSST